MSIPPGSIVADHLWKRFREDRKPPTSRRRRIPGMRPPRGWRWALQDVSLHVEPGDSGALVGLNGSGKSTLLKILSGAMFPYAGRLSIEGRIGALIEVRAGIHPDLTGRENIYFNG